MQDDNQNPDQLDPGHSNLDGPNPDDPNPDDPNLDEQAVLPAPLTPDPAEARPPARYRERHDGWTVARQNQFIESLTRTGCVLDACRMAAISSTSAYNHRQRDPDFDERWGLALRRAKTPIGEVAWKRAVDGVEQEVWYHGKVVGKRTRHYSDVLRLLIQRDDNGAGRDAQGRFAPANVGAGGAGGTGADDVIIDAHAKPHVEDIDVDEPTMVEGRKVYPKWLATPEPAPGPPKDRLEEKLKLISDRIGEIGSRSINVRTGQGITDEIIEVVQRFVDGGRVMLPAKLKWMDPEKFEKAKAEFLAEFPGGVPEDRKAEFNRD